MSTLPEGATVYFKRSVPSGADALPNFLTRELGIVERAIRDTRIFPVRTVTADHTITASDGVVLGDATTAPITITLPDVRKFWGYTFLVKKVDGSANAVTASSAQLIDGATTFPLTVPYQSVTLFSSGTEWLVL